VRGLKPRCSPALNAVLKGRSSTVDPVVVSVDSAVAVDPAVGLGTEPAMRGKAIAAIGQEQRTTFKEEA